jgi:hypothetical protein
MNLKYSIQHKLQQIDFSVNTESGSLIIEANGEIESIEIPHKVAIDLIEILQSKLYDHQLQSESLLKRLFK